MYSCIGIHSKYVFQICFNIHMCDMPLEMNLFSETDNNAKNELLKNVLCTVDDTAVSTQVHSSVITNEESANIWGIIQNVTCFILNMDQCITANITLQLHLKRKEKEEPNNNVPGSEKGEPTNNSFHSITYGNCSCLVSCDCGSLLSGNTEKHMYKGFFKKWNLFLKNFESSDYCDCILYIHKGQGKVTPGSHAHVYLVFVLSTSIAMLVILTVIVVYLI